MKNTGETQAILPVTPEDRAAAWPHRPTCYDGKADKWKWDDGVYDKCDVIQAFARHRISHSLPGDVGRIVHRNGPVVVDWMGENLAWRPLDYGTWTPFEDTPSPSPGDVGTADLLEQVDMWGDCRCDGFSIGHEPDCTRRIVEAHVNEAPHG